MANATNTMKKLAFVIPWFSKNNNGGAEIALEDLTRRLADAGIALEILTTCVEKFASDWSVNFFPRGVETIKGIPVRRFKAEPRHKEGFDAVNRKLLLNMPISLTEEVVFLNEMVNSDELTDYIATHHDNYSLFVFIPYMFGTTYFGITAAGKKAVLIPCFHNELPAKMQLCVQQYAKVSGIAFLAQPEADFAQKTYDLSSVDARVLGLGVQDTKGDALCFRTKYKLGNTPFLLYAGRKDVGKNVDLLLQYFVQYRRIHPESPLKLVLIGGGELEIPLEIMKDTVDLGFLPLQDKYDAYAAATVFCQPSQHESFSIVIMESWLAGRPVMVSGACAVTKNFAITSGGGLYFDGASDFVCALHYLVSHPEQADMMGAAGQTFVRTQFNWDKIIQDYIAFFTELAARADEK